MKSRFFTGLSAVLLPLAIAGNFANADQHPEYDEVRSELTLPAINVADQPARFQDAILELVDDNLWQLKDVYESKLNQNIEQVVLILTETAPVQVFLKISGVYPHGCARTGQTHAQVDGNTIIISSFYQNNLWVRNPEIVACTLAMEPFSFIYPLPVYGLPSGEYEYRVNGEFSGSFTLHNHNVISP